MGLIALTATDAAEGGKSAAEILTKLPSGAAGAAVAVVPAATAGGHAISAEDAVYSGDMVRTGGGGEVQLMFRDATRMVVGPGSSLVIDNFVYNPNNTAKSFSIDAARGTFRFITGLSPKPVYQITTSTATIGIRGTRFDIAVGAGHTAVAVYDGTARICGNGGGCIELRGNCQMAEAPSREPAKKVTSAEDRLALLQKDFPYALDQSSLRSDFRVGTKGCGVAANNSPSSTTTTVASVTSTTTSTSTSTSTSSTSTSTSASTSSTSSGTSASTSSTSSGTSASTSSTSTGTSASTSSTSSGGSSTGASSTSSGTSASSGSSSSGNASSGASSSGTTSATSSGGGGASSGNASSGNASSGNASSGNASSGGNGSSGASGR